MSERRVGITGLGVVTAAGVGIEPLWQALLARRGGLRRIALFDPSGFPCQVGGELTGFSAREFVPKGYRKAVKVMARDIEIAVAGADLAFRDSGITTAGIDEAKVDVDSARLGCNVGAGLICADLDELGTAVNTSVTDGRFDIRRWGREGMNNLTPLWLLKYLPNMLSCHVTIIHQCKGSSNCITCGEASSHLSVGEAFRHIGRGACDVAVAGGAESKLNPMGLLRQGLLGRLNNTANDRPEAACRPFDAAAAGTVIGEGGALLVLEELERAYARAARVYAEVVGFGAACDPDGINFLQPTAGGLAPAIRAALRDAKIEPGQVDLVVPSGSGVPAEDAAEADALVEALGPHARQLSVLPMAGSVGNLFAGAGGVALAVAAAALHKQTVPPAPNFEAPNPRCGLNVPRQAEPRKLRYALCSGFSVGGQAAAVVLKASEQRTANSEQRTANS